MAGGRHRIDGLDMWRAVLMLLGILYHGVMLRPDLPLFEVITVTSNTGRMGLFFAISGLVVAKALEKHPPGVWLRHRLLSIGVPTAFGLFVICPLTMLSLHLVPPAMRPPSGFPQWFHIWFLVALLLYAPAGYALHRLDARYGLFAGAAADVRLVRHAQPLMLLVVPLVSFTLMQLTMMVVTRTTPVSMWFGLIQLRPTAGYLPLFLLGFILGRSDELRCAVTDRLTLPVLVVAGVAAAYLGWFLILSDRVPLADRGWMGAVLLIAGSALCPPALFVLVIRHAYAVRRVPRALRRLADASFTIYLVHYPIELAINGLFLRTAWAEYAEWAVAVAVTLGLSYALHDLLVRRSAVAALVVNGVLPRRREERQAADAESSGESWAGQVATAA